MIFAQDVPHYGSVEIDAVDDAEALAAAKAYDLSDVACDPDWKNSTCKRIVTIEDESGNVIAEDISLDNWFLYHALIDTVLCGAPHRDSSPRCAKSPPSPCGVNRYPTLASGPS